MAVDVNTIAQGIGFFVSAAVAVFKAFRAANAKLPKAEPTTVEAEYVPHPPLLPEANEQEPTYDGIPMSEEGGIMFKERCDDLDRRIKSAENALDRKLKELERLQNERHSENCERLDDLSRRLDQNTRDLRHSIEGASATLRELMSQRNAANNDRTERLLQQLLERLPKQ